MLSLEAGSILSLLGLRPSSLQSRFTLSLLTSDTFANIFCKFQGNKKLIQSFLRIQKSYFEISGNLYIIH